LKNLVDYELPNPGERKQKLQAYPELLQVIDAVTENWDARNSFLSRQSDIANAALLWLENKKPANRQAYELWLELLDC
jgi:hypothetical protein